MGNFHGGIYSSIEVALFWYATSFPKNGQHPWGYVVVLKMAQMAQIAPYYIKNGKSGGKLPALKVIILLQYSI